MFRRVRTEAGDVHGSRIVTGLAVVFGSMAGLFAVFGFVYSPAFLVVAALFGAVTYFMWYHASGRLAERLYRGVERQASTGERRQGRGGPGRGGFGAGPREEWTPPRDGTRARASGQARGARGARTGRASAGRASAGGRARQRAGQPDGLSTQEAYRILDLDPGADQSEIKSSYREKVKDVHPDSSDGDEEAFKRVKDAYELLSD